MSRKSSGVVTDGVFASCPCGVGEAQWSLELSGPVFSVEVEGKSTTAGCFLALGCSADRESCRVQYGAQFSATKNVNLYFLPWNSLKDLKFHTQLASAFSLHM